MSSAGKVALSGSSDIDLWMQGSIYTTSGARTYAQKTLSYTKPSGLLDLDGRVFGKSRWVRSLDSQGLADQFQRPQYQAYSSNEFESVKGAGKHLDSLTSILWPAESGGLLLDRRERL